MRLALQRLVEYTTRAAGTFSALAGNTKLLFQVLNAADPGAGSSANLTTSDFLTDANVHNKLQLTISMLMRITLIVNIKTSPRQRRSTGNFIAAVGQACGRSCDGEPEHFAAQPGERI
jgi:hypothetical protein